jgi:preprotein translocase subunit YajC
MVFAFIAQAGGTASGGGILGFLPFILILVIIYFLMLRPQMKRQKEHAAMISRLQKNDEIVTSGGLHGRIVRINDKDNTLLIQVSRGVVITIERSAVARKKIKGEATKQLPEKQVQQQKQKEPEASEPKPNQKSAASSSSGNAGVVTTQPGSGSEGRGRGRRRPRRSNPRQRQPNKSSDNEASSN